MIGKVNSNLNILFYYLRPQNYTKDMSSHMDVDCVDLNKSNCNHINDNMDSGDNLLLDTVNAVTLPHITPDSLKVNERYFLS